MQNRQSSSALLQVLKVLNDDVAKSGVHANHIHAENKATCSSLSAEYDQVDLWAARE